MEEKKCTNCLKLKPLDDFYWQNKTTNKKHAQCKICSEQKRKSKEHYLKYKDEYVSRSRKRQLKLLIENRIKLLDYLKDHPCVDCGESNPIMLEFDHLKDKKYGISNMMQNYTWEQILQEIEKCEVVCANHHKVRTAKQFGWYKISENSFGDSQN